MWHNFDANNDGYNDSWYWDGDNDGRAEQVWVNQDGDRDYDAVIYDSNEDGRAEWVRVDADQNGHWDTWLGDYDNDGRIGDYILRDWDGNGRNEFGTWDSNEDGIAEYLCQDTNQDGYADTWSAVARAQSPTIHDQWADLFIKASNNRLASIWLS